MGGRSLPHFKEEEMGAQREVTGLAQDLPAGKWLRARSAPSTALAGRPSSWEQHFPAGDLE